MTLTEVVLAASILVMLTLSITASAYLLSAGENGTRANTSISDKTRLLMDKMVWGKRVNGAASRMSISEANKLQLPVVNPVNSQLDFRQGANTWHSIRRNGLNVEYRPAANAPWVTLYDPDGPNSNDTAHYSTTLTFSQTNPNAVAINLRLGAKHNKGGWTYASLSTQIDIRNAA